MSATKITVETTIKASIEKVWDCFTKPEHVTKWYNASDDWHAPHAENDLRVGGKFLTRMEAKDKSMGFDFEGIYSAVKVNELIEYGLADGRKVKVSFQSLGDATKVTETFDAENENPVDMQKAGWQAILDNFKKHVGSQK